MPSGVFINPATGTSPLRWKIVYHCGDCGKGAALQPTTVL